jgi:hypothetical protein
MSNELKRYDIDGRDYDLVECKDGDMVHHSDALAAIEAAKPKWRYDLENAPKDGTESVFLTDLYGSVVMFWGQYGASGKWLNGIDDDLTNLVPIAWLPLPQKASR